MQYLSHFLGVPRWKALARALKSQSSTVQGPGVGTGAIVLALAVTLLPVGLTFVDSLSPETRTIIPTVGFGTCAILSLLIRRGYGLEFKRPQNWRADFSLTHTAFALGCLPAVLIVILSPSLLAERHDLLVEPIMAPAGPRQKIDIVAAVSMVFLISAWVAITEELIFRGLLVSMLRRWSLFKNQRHRDLCACAVSAVVFGLAHYATWGPFAALALVGLGMGFVAAYIANGENFISIVVYHFFFDALSISVSVFL